MCGAQNASESFCIAEIRLGIAVKVAAVKVAAGRRQDCWRHMCHYRLWAKGPPQRPTKAYWRHKTRIGAKKRRGAARGGERPKSREETPKVGYDIIGRTEHAAGRHMGLFVVHCNCDDPAQGTFLRMCCRHAPARYQAGAYLHQSGISYGAGTGTQTMRSTNRRCSEVCPFGAEGRRPICPAFAGIPGRVWVSVS